MNIKKLLKTIPYIIIALLVGVTVTYAGSLTPPGSVANTMYSLTDIWNLHDGTTGTLGSGTIETTPTTIAETGKTLTEVYTDLVAEIAKLSTASIASGTTAFNIVGAGIISLGDAINTNVLAGKHFSNVTTANVLGTMPDKTGLNVASTAQSQAGGINYFTAVEGYYDGTAKVSATDAEVAALDADIAVGNIKSGTSIFGVPGTYEGTPGTNYGLPKTGQITCWNTDGSAQDPCLAGNQVDGGQDGYYRKGVALAYAGNGTTVTDNATGLIWQKQDDGVTKTWTVALAYCNANTAGLPGTGWRLPNQRELLSIVDYNYISPAINPIFLSTRSGYYWSSTSFQNPGLQEQAWFVDFYGSYTYYDVKTGEYFVRCVRG